MEQIEKNKNVHSVNSDDLKVKFLISERKKDKHQRFEEFEHILRYVLIERNEDIDKFDWFMLDQLKHAIIVFLLKNEFNEHNETFLANTQSEFYSALDRIKEKIPSWESEKVKLFVEDFIFKCETEGDKIKNAIETVKTFEMKDGITIKIQAGPYRWSIRTILGTVEHKEKDVRTSTEENFKEAYEYCLNNYGKLTQVTDEEDNE